MQLKKIVFLVVLAFSIQSLASQTILNPQDHFGFKPGSVGNLFTYEQLIEYLKILDKNSDKIKLEEIGTSPMGKPMFIAFISSKENIENLTKLQEINRDLALNPDIPDDKLSAYQKKGKVFVLATLSMHSGEVGPSQSAPLIAYDLINSQEAEIKNTLDDVVYMMVPCHNPDGMNMVVNHYNKYKGTKYEGSSLPGVYHKYVGHDNNRDFLVLSQSDTRAISDITSKTWFPQVMVEKHQMGSTGPRYFVPPFHDPISENNDAELYTWVGLFGQNMLKDMTAKGQKGISQHYIFDNYWPGSTETCLWKNVIAFLTEAASAKYAKPVYIEPTELKVYGKGLSEYKKSTNMLEPWPGGWWRLEDIVNYEIESTYSILRTASIHRERILKFRNDLCRKEINKGLTLPPYYYILPKEQKDKSELVALVNLLNEHGVQVHQLTEDIHLENYLYKKGDIVVKLAQPFRSFVKEVMELQTFPERHYTPGGELIKPYDITSWSLPLHKGLESKEINKRSEKLEDKLEQISSKFTLFDKPEISQYILLSSYNNESYKIAFKALKNGFKVERTKEKVELNGASLPAGSFVIKNSAKFYKIIENATIKHHFVNVLPEIEKQSISLPKIALVESYFHDMDAGWTRFILDTYGVVYTVLRPGDFEKTDLEKNYDIIIFPDENPEILKEGKRKRGGTYYLSEMPPEFTRGIGKKGFEKLMKFSQSGGIIISWGESTDLFSENLTFKNGDEKEEFKLPFNDISSNLAKEGLYSAGAFAKIQLKQNHPLTYGFDESTGVFYRGKPVFTTSIPSFDADRRVIGSFKEGDIKLSGYIANEKLLANKSAMLWLKKGNAQFVLMGFSPIFRASTPASYKLLFNSLFLRKIE